MTVDPLVEAEVGRATERHLVTVLAPDIDAATLEGVAGRIARCGGNIERIVRLSAYPVHSYELSVAGADLDGLRRALAQEAARRQVDIAVQVAGLHRRAKHLIVMDADSTLLQDEVVDLLAERCGCGPQVAAVTAGGHGGRGRLRGGAAAPGAAAGRADGGRPPGRARRHPPRAGGPHAGAHAQAARLRARRGERRLHTGDRSRWPTELGIDHLAANVLVLDGGVLTGELDGAIVDRAGKAAALVRFAEAAGVPLARTIAVGDGANDIDMLATAGLGIAFNAKPVVRRAADTALSVPYLDAILFLLGISRREVELADRLEPEVAP